MDIKLGQLITWPQGLWPCGLMALSKIETESYRGHSISSQRKIFSDPFGFPSNLVRMRHLLSNLATPNFKLICQVFLDLWSLEFRKFYDISVIFVVL